MMVLWATPPAATQSLGETPCGDRRALETVTRPFGETPGNSAISWRRPRGRRTDFHGPTSTFIYSPLPTESVKRCLTSDETDESWTFLHVNDNHMGTARSYRFRPAINRRWAAIKRQMAAIDAKLSLARRRFDARWRNT